MAKSKDDDLRTRLANLGVAKREVRGIDETNASKAIRRRISAIAHKNGLVVEWTLRPTHVNDDAAQCGCGCGCGCGCSCIA